MKPASRKRKQKAQAESDDRKMQEMCGNLSSLDKASCQLLVEQVSNCECIDEIKKKHISLINKRVDEIDSEHLDSLIIDLSSMDEAACNRLTEEINAYPASEHLKTAYTNKVAARIKEIWEAEDFERYVEIYQATPVGDSAAVGRSCSQIQQIGRTELKEKFVNALYFLNENEVAAAAKYIVSQKGNVISALLNSGKKASYDILTLDGRVMHPGIEGAVAALREKKSGGFLSGLMGKRTTAAPHSAAPAVAGSKFCPNCGNKLEQSAKFCPSCGAKQN